MNNFTRTAREDTTDSTNARKPGLPSRAVSRIANAWRPHVRRLRRSGRVLAQAAADNSRLAVRAADYQVHVSPWRFIAITALAAAAIGFVSGYRRSHVRK
jgi:ElaB/YqjD/DUF883 family membrane-anchored ribosome-binding protein